MATSYNNAGGKGDRTASITTTCSAVLFESGGYDDPTVLVNGVTAGAMDLCFKNATPVSGKYIRFDFGAAASKTIDEAKYYQQTTASQGTWKWQGSNNAVDWTDIGSTFTMGGVATQTQTELNGNTSGYRYYQIIGTAGNSDWGPWVYEFEFQIDDYSTDVNVNPTVKGLTVGKGTPTFAFYGNTYYIVSSTDPDVLDLYIDGTLVERTTIA